MLDDTTNQPSKFRTRNWIGINNESKERYDNSNIIFKVYVTKLNLCDYSNAYLLLKGTITLPNTEVAAAAVNITNKNITFANYGHYSDCVTEINNTQIDNSQKIYVVILKYKLAAIVMIRNFIAIL